MESKAGPFSKCERYCERYGKNCITPICYEFIVHQLAARLAACCTTCGTTKLHNLSKVELMSIIIVKAQRKDERLS